MDRILVAEITIEVWQTTIRGISAVEIQHTAPSEKRKIYNLQVRV